MSDTEQELSTSRRRILIIANETVEGTVLYQAIRFRARNVDAEVLVIAPALNSRLRHWISDEDEARRAAEARLARSLDRLAGVGIDADGLVGDADPLLAIADGLSGFPANEIIIATHPEAGSHWLGRNLVDRARSRFALPILRIVVDTARGHEYVADHGAAQLASTRSSHDAA